MSAIYPPPLRPGDTIGFVAPAGVPEMTTVERARSRFESLGYPVKVFGDLQQRRGYLAGDDRSRADALMAAFADTECRAVLPVRGGYGCIRLLEHLDFDLIRAHPKVFVGFSDNTVLHAAFWRHCGLVTFHGPHPCDGIGHADGWSPLTERSFWHAVGHDFSASTTADPVDVGDAALRSLVGGVTEGKLVGGNLALVCALMGTPAEIDLAGGILLLEDINEPPYRVDRMLAQLTQAGVFDRVSGVLLGHFTDCVADHPQHSLTLDEVFADYLEPLSIPILAGVPAGHERDNITLPLGVRCRVDAIQQTIKMG